MRAPCVFAEDARAEPRVAEAHGDAGQTEPHREAPERPAAREPQPNRIYVRSLFVDLIDSLPDASETQRMRNALDGLADSGPLRSVIARLLIDSGQVVLPEKQDIEDPTQWIGSLFERYLGRAARPVELSAFVQAFHDPECRPETVVYAIVSHPEYQTW